MSTTISPVTSPGQHATIAAVLRDAATLIRVNGCEYRPDGNRWDIEGPHSMSSAIDAAAFLRAQRVFATEPAPHCYPDKPEVLAADLSEEAHTPPGRVPVPDRAAHPPHRHP